MPKDTYANIIAELHVVVKQIADIEKRAKKMKKQMHEKSDQIKIKRIKKQIGV